MAKPKTPAIDRFTEAETSALADLTGDLASVAKTSPERAAAITAAQFVDHSDGPEGKAELEILHSAAIEADSLLKSAGPGRPPISEARRNFRDQAEAMSEAPALYESAWRHYQKVIADLRDAGPMIDNLEAQAEEHARQLTEVVEHLEAAGNIYATAVDLADSGRAVMGQLAGRVCFAASPFIEMNIGRYELRDTAKRFRLRLSAEQSRLNIDPDDTKRERLEAAESQQYTVDLAKACAAYRTTSAGAEAWATYQRAQRTLRATQAEQPQGSHERLRELVQLSLNDFYKGACEVAGLNFDPAFVPVA